MLGIGRNNVYKLLKEKLNLPKLREESYEALEDVLFERIIYNEIHIKGIKNMSRDLRREFGKICSIFTKMEVAHFYPMVMIEDGHLLGQLGV